MVCAFILLHSIVLSITFSTFTFHVKWVVYPQNGNDEADRDVKLRKLLYLLNKTLPLLQDIQREQRYELEVEASMHGTLIWFA